jgi:hypothetical protein
MFMKDLEQDLQSAFIANQEELKLLAYHPSSKVLSNMLLNRNITEDIVVIIAGRRNISSEILESLSTDLRWKDAYRIVSALCRNPKTPQKVSLSLLKRLRIFDLADLTRNPQIPVNVRMKAEASINEKVLVLPIGIKKTLAKKASGKVLIRLVEDGMKEVVTDCLDSPIMTESMICRIIHMKRIAAQVIRQITEHPKWALRYDVQWALIRSHHAPLSRVVHFLKNMRSKDLKELYKASEVPTSTKPFIYRELMDRNEAVRD